ncbi:pleiotropic drug resistance protein 2-like [Pyrus ussuriensis x Pyrus communis]|uniref:Pleiotropic drug resistance protein 2-like n=1 Tax=Pyrus ussuriensis x Pyrus communis TaxID=2448454 RepID=A0A5N5FX85_9ROSA|nr:pleiotropic drug resistance protein 2-like [Pyrus ussuriensis x Pyrus communis]
MALSLFRFIAALGRTQVVASTLGTFTLLMAFILGGFIVAKNDLERWMLWGYYISPMMYGQNAIVMNEFLDKRWSAPNTDPKINASTIGKVLLKSRGFFTDEYWFWICIGALFGFSFLFNILFIAALTFLNPLGDAKAVIAGDESEGKRRKSFSEEMTAKSSSEIACASDHAPKKGIVLPFQPLSLAFNHVNYFVDIPPEMKTHEVEEDHLQLLRDVSGAFRVLERQLLWTNSLVGLPELDGLSTEQRKRLTIVVGLVANLSIIFMDEPTSGFDARAAAIAMRTVRNTVDTGRTVVCTIH